GNLSEKQKTLLELLPNAPSIYIFDLKVTAYQNLYFDGGIPVMLADKRIAGQVLHDALRDFARGDYKSCDEKMGALLFQNPNDVNALFYSGMCNFYGGKCREADAFFQRVLASQNNVFRQEAQWFSTLCMGRQGQKEAERKSLQQIGDMQGFYA